MSSLLNYFGFGATKPELSTQPQQEAVKTAVKALPANWYTSQPLYDLERRAIFSRKWLMITHQIRIRQPGEYIRYEAANFVFILYRDASGNVKGIHNTSGLSGQPIVQEQKGTLDLSAAESFTFPIHIRVDAKGFIWVNLDGAETPEIAWEEDFDGVDTQPRFEGFNFNEEYEFDHEWEMTGDYNWKILADNYNECYHCASTHPDLKEMADLETYSVTTQDGYILHNVRGRPGSEGEKRYKVHPTYYYPSTSMNVSPHFFFMQRFVPHGPVKSTMRYEVYRHKDAPESEFQFIAQMYRRVMSEDKALCEASQQNLNRGVFTNGEMHPRLEQGPLFFQSKCRDLVKEHRQREMLVKREIWPTQLSWTPRRTAAPAKLEIPSVPAYYYTNTSSIEQGSAFASVAA